MAYVDGFVLPVAKNNLRAYARIARAAGKIWREHGALDFRECVGDDLKIEGMMPFGRPLKLKRGETAMFSWIAYKSRAHRDRVNARVMKDPRMHTIVGSGPVPFDPQRMMYGGFRVLVQA